VFDGHFRDYTKPGFRTQNKKKNSKKQTQNLVFKKFVLTKFFTLDFIHLKRRKRQITVKILFYRKPKMVYLDGAKNSVKIKILRIVSEDGEKIVIFRLT
jgi:hypothetical protein